MATAIQNTVLIEEARRRYLNYALSVITSRALPDVRDGLKPVQRRILFTMRKDLGLVPDAKYRKSAKIIGDVMGGYHPHGDQAIYDAMVRMVQSWVMRVPLVDGQGNFGSIDGDSPAAYRYTEAKLKSFAMELLTELDQRTVAFRPNYDGTRSEPIVLPARVPNLLINGSQGIAVGMATNIPPHNPKEVIDACMAMIDAKSPLSTAQLLKHIKGPDFPTGGMLLSKREELIKIYESGSGSIKLRGEYKVEEKRGGTLDLIVTSIPYGVEKSTIVKSIGELIAAKKMASLVDVRDESTEPVETRIVIELKKGTDPQLAMAYLYKHTSLQVSVGVNLTCLTPAATTDEDDEVFATPLPQRLSLAAMLQYFLDFRFETVTRRIRFELQELEQRIHILEGLMIIFDGLDEAIRIIRKSEGKADAAKKLIKRFELSEEQVDAILELRLYKLAQLEMELIRKELQGKKQEAKKRKALLANQDSRWSLIKDELTQLKATFGDKRRTKIGGSDEPEFSAEDFIAEEDANVILSTQGWVKRVRELKDISTTRLREGDSVLAVAAGSTRSSVAFFSNVGVCYVLRIHEVPQSTGYGDPVQKLFKMADGERIVAMLSFDSRILDVTLAVEDTQEPQPPFAIALTRSGMALRFSLTQHREVSTRAGRKYARLNDNDEVVFVTPVADRDCVVAATSDGFCLGLMAKEISVLASAGKGTQFIFVAEGERVVGATMVVSSGEKIQIETEKQKTISVVVNSVMGKRGSDGFAVVKRDRLARIVPSEVLIPTLETNSNLN